MKRIAWAVIFFVPLTVLAKDDPRVTYVGGGRYTCEGSSEKCAQIDQQNHLNEALKSSDRQRSEDAANRYVREERERQEQATRNRR